MNNYVITMDKFMSVKETKTLMRVCRKKAEADYRENRITWINRYMLIHLALHSGLILPQKCRHPHATFFSQFSS